MYTYTCIHVYIIYESTIVVSVWWLKLRASGNLTVHTISHQHGLTRAKCFAKILVFSFSADQEGKIMSLALNSISGWTGGRDINFVTNVVWRQKCGVGTRAPVG